MSEKENQTENIDKAASTWCLPCKAKEKRINELLAAVGYLKRECIEQEIHVPDFVKKAINPDD